MLLYIHFFICLCLYIYVFLLCSSRIIGTEHAIRMKANPLFYLDVEQRVLGNQKRLLQRREKDAKQEELLQTVIARGESEGLWIFAYGSLMWRVGFEFVEKRNGYVKGWVRRFYQQVSI